jgi:hypothetical protein
MAWSEVTWWREIAKLACLQLARGRDCARGYGSVERAVCINSEAQPSTIRCSRCWERALAETANANQKQGASRL